MADKKISQLTNLTGANLAENDEFVLVDTSADETKAITFGELKTAFDTGTGFVRVTGDTMTGNLTVPTVDINGGTIDGTVIGGTTPAAGNFTTGSFTGNATFGDNDKAIFGAGSDLQIYAAGGNSFIQDTGSGSLFVTGASGMYLQNGSNETYLDAFSNGAVRLFYDNAQKLATTSTGIDVTGTVTADGLTVDTNTLHVDSTNNRVGIGTSSPSTSLHVKTGLNQNLLVGSDGGIVGLFSVNDAVSGTEEMLIQGRDLRFNTGVGATERMRIDSSGNVGIGTSSPSDTLSVVGYGASGTGTQISSGTATTDTRFKARTELWNGIVSLYDSGGNEDVRISAASGVDTYFNSGSNVGIGTTSPQDTGVGYSNLTINGTTGGVIDLTDDNVRVGSFFNTANDVSLGNFTATGFLGFRTNSLERMRIDSSGNVGIGTSSPLAALSVGAGSLSDANLPIQISTGASGNRYVGINKNGAYALLVGYEATADQAEIRNIQNTPIVFKTNDAERMRIDSSGNVGIGRSPSSGCKLDIEANNQRSRLLGTTGYVVSEVTNNGGSFSLGKENSSGGGFMPTTGAYDSVLVSQGSVNMVFGTNNTERMRIDSSGSVGIGRTPSYRLDVDSNGSVASGRFNRYTDGTLRTLLIFRSSSNGSDVGAVYINNTSTSYNTSSDYRLKTDAQPMTGASARVQALKPVNFEWIADGTRVDGFLAHEAQEVVPEAVTGTKDAMRDEEYEVTPAVLDDDGNVVTEAVMGTRSVPDYQGIDQSKLVPLLTAALQEALTKIEALEARVTALEA